MTSQSKRPAHVIGMMPVATMLIAIAVCAGGVASADVKKPGQPAKHGALHGPGSSHNPIVRHPPLHGPGSSHNPIVAAHSKPLGSHEPHALPLRCEPPPCPVSQ